MFGPLPLRHTIALIGVALVVSVLLGAWAGLLEQIQIQVVPGIVVGGAVGTVLAYLLVRPSAHSPTHRRLR